MLRTPNRRIKRRYLLIASDPEPEFPATGNLIQETTASIAGNELDEPAAVHVGGTREAQGRERAFDGDPLRVEDARLRADQDAGAHQEMRGSAAVRRRGVVESLI